MQNCMYKVEVKTGDVAGAGTDSKISVSLFNNKLETITVSDLEKWAIDPSRNHFERNNLDMFLGEAQCLTSPVCGLVLKSDNTGYKSGWFVSYLDVTTYSVPQESIHFNVDQWLATSEYPYELTTIRNLCDNNTLNDKNMPLSLLETVV